MAKLVVGYIPLHNDIIKDSGFFDEDNRNFNFVDNMSFSDILLKSDVMKISNNCMIIIVTSSKHF